MEEYRKKDDRGRSKAKRLTADPHTKVDSSTWTPPEALDADVKTGARPLVKRLYKKGGKVVGKHEGKDSVKHAGRMPRKSGGRTDKLTPDSLINRDVRTANESREGKKHEGAFKKGGAAKKFGGGPIGDNPIGEQNKMMSKAAGTNLKKGGRAKYGTGGGPYDNKKGREPDEGYDSKLGAPGSRERAIIDYAGDMPSKTFLDNVKRGASALPIIAGAAGARALDAYNRMGTNKDDYQKHKKGGKVKGREHHSGMDGDNVVGKDPIGDLIRRLPQSGQKNVPAQQRAVPQKKNTIDDYLKRSTLDEERAANAKAFDEEQQRYLRSLPQNQKRGGKAMHPDIAEDKKLIKKMVKPSAMKGDEKCWGGRTKKYGGGGVFSGDSKSKVPGATGGRKAKFGGGALIGSGGGNKINLGGALGNLGNLGGGNPMTAGGNNYAQSMPGGGYTGPMNPPALGQLPLRGQDGGYGMMPTDPLPNSPQISNVGSNMFRGGMRNPDMGMRGPVGLRGGNKLLPPGSGGMPRSGGPTPLPQGQMPPGGFSGGPTALPPGLMPPGGGTFGSGLPGYQPGMPIMDGSGGGAYKRGGRTKGKTQVNIVIASGHHGQPMDSSPNMPVQAPRPPMGVPVPPPATAGGAPMAGGMPPQMPPPGMMPRKSGGRTNYPIETGSGGGKARLDKIPAYGLKPPRGK